MKTFDPPLRVILILFGLLHSLVGVNAVEPVEDKVAIIRVTNATLEDSESIFELGVAVKRLQEEKAKGIVLDINSNVGNPMLVVRIVRENLADLGIPVIAWANPSATGAGAVLALGADKIFIAPFGTLGGIVAGGDGPSQDEEVEADGKKPVKASDGVLKAAVRAIAEAKGHDLTIAEAFVDPAKEIEGLTQKDELLTLTASQGGGIASPAKAIEELLVAADLDDAETVKIDRISQFNRASSASATPDVADETGNETKAAKKEQEGDGLFVKAEEESYAGKIVVIEITDREDLVRRSRFKWFSRAIEKASDDGASAVILDMNTPGGFAWETEELMMDVLANSKCTTITFVNPNAISAGAMIALATDEIYMAPAARIGAAAAHAGGMELGETMKDKVSSAQIATTRNVASLKGHNPDVAEAFIDKAKEVWIGGVLISPEGKLLTLNTDQAVRVIEGRPVLAKSIAVSVAAIIEAESLEGEILKPTPYGMERFAMWIEVFSTMLIFVGIAGAYLEIKTPGFGLPGLISVLAFTLFFFGNYVAGNLAGWEVAVVFMLGIVLVVVEVFILPGMMIPGLIGVLLIIGSLAYAMIDRFDFDLVRSGAESAPDWSGLLFRPFLNLGIGLALAGVLLFVAVTYLPETRMMRWAILDSSAAGTAVAPAMGKGIESLVGLEGSALTDLRPSGKGAFGGEVLDVTSESEFVTRGAKIRVSQREGNRVVVEVI
jgi:membrane-bound serine protease (ClpP class)